MTDTHFGRADRTLTQWNVTHKLIIQGKGIPVFSKEPMADTFLLMVSRYEDLTESELVGMKEFVRLVNEGNIHEAFRSCQVCLDLEHFIAVLPLDPAEFGPRMMAELLELRKQCFDITGQFIKLNALGERKATPVSEKPATKSALDTSAPGQQKGS
jgi:hypothetical protein